MRKLKTIIDKKNAIAKDVNPLDTHTVDGRFAKGNMCGKGSTIEQRWNKAMIEEFKSIITPHRLRSVMLSVIRAARKGNIHAAKILMDKINDLLEVYKKSDTPLDQVNTINVSFNIATPTSSPAPAPKILDVDILKELE